jgi:hypothetical protein
MFLDLSDYLLISKGGIQEATSIHVKWLEDETSFRWTMRVGGAPLMRSAVTMPDGWCIRHLSRETKIANKISGLVLIQSTDYPFLVECISRSCRKTGTVKISDARQLLIARRQDE